MEWQLLLFSELNDAFGDRMGMGRDQESINGFSVRIWIGVFFKYQQLHQRANDLKAFYIISVSNELKLWFSFVKT